MVAIQEIRLIEGVEIESGVYQSFLEALSSGRMERIESGREVNLREATKDGGKVFLVLKMGEDLPENKMAVLLEMTGKKVEMKSYDARGVLYTTGFREELKINTEAREFLEEVSFNFGMQAETKWYRGESLGTVEVQVPGNFVGYRGLLSVLPSNVHSSERMSEMKEGVVRSSISEEPGGRYDLEILGLNWAERKRIFGESTTDDIILEVFVLPGKRASLKFR